MTARTQLGVVTLIAVATLGVFWWLTTRVEVPSVSAKPKAQDAAVSQPVKDVVAPSDRRAVLPTTGPSTDPFAAALAALSTAIEGGNGAGAAASMRHLLRTDQVALAQAYEALLAEGTEADLRRAIAMVLGTLAVDGIDEVLLAALQQFDGDADTVLTLIAALGALRDPPDEDDVFDMSAAPHFAVHGPGGMGITVRNVISDPLVEEALGNLLLDGDRRDVRMAAANALQFSINQEFSRTRFRTALANELDDGVASMLAQSLGYWTRRKLSNEARHIVDEVVLVADRPGFDEYRMRVETALQDSAYGEAALGQLHSWTQRGMSFEMRSFAFSILLSQKAVGSTTRSALVEIVANDPDRAMRDYAAGQLGKLPFGSDSRGALQALFQGGTDWSLRLTALSSLVELLPASERDALLQQAASDADSRIARRAERLAKRFR
jgi:hypothetical protein